MHDYSTTIWLQASTFVIAHKFLLFPYFSENKMKPQESPRRVKTVKLQSITTSPTSQSIDRLCLTTDQFQRVNKRERLLTSTSMQSGFSRMLRDAVKPTKPPSRPIPKSARSYTSSITASRAGERITPGNKQYRAKSTPSLRMKNEESSFTHYVRLNRSAYHRLDGSQVTWGQ